MSDPFNKDNAKSLLERILVRAQKELVIGSILKQMLDTDNHPVKLGKLNCSYNNNGTLASISRLYRINGMALRVEIMRSYGYSYDYTMRRVVNFTSPTRSKYVVGISVLHENLIEIYGSRNYANFNLKFDSIFEFDYEDVGMDLAMFEELSFKALKDDEDAHINLFEIRCAEIEKVVKSLSMYLRN